MGSSRWAPVSTAGVPTRFHRTTAVASRIVSALHDLTALEQGALVRRREVSPAELVEHYLDRVDDVGAFVVRTPELALDRAEELGRSLPAEGGSPLYGVPTAIKDLNLTAGVPTAFGSAAFADFVPDVSDAVTLAVEARGPGQPGQDQHSGVRVAVLHRAGGPPAGRDPVGPKPDGRWVFGRSRRGGRGRAGAGRAGLRRGWVDQDPRVLLRLGRAQADAWADLRGPDVRRPGGARARPGRWRGPSATPQPCWTCWPVGRWATRSGRRSPHRRSWLPVTGSPRGSGWPASRSR